MSEPCNCHHDIDHHVRFARLEREREDLLLELKVAHPHRHGANCRVCVKIAACEEEKEGKDE